MAAIFQTTFWNAFSWMKIYEFRLKFNWSLFLRVHPALVRIMTWRLPGDKPLSEPMLLRSPTHICVTQLQWVKPISWIVERAHEILPAILKRYCFFHKTSADWFIAEDFLLTKLFGFSTTLGLVMASLGARKPAVTLKAEFVSHIYSWSALQCKRLICWIILHDRLNTPIVFL